MQTEYHEVPLNDIIHYFTKDLTHQQGQIVGKPEYFIDAAKNVVVLKLYVMPTGNKLAVTDPVVKEEG